MKYFITEAERKGTCYHEWAEGRFDGTSFWQPQSILISEEIHFALGLEKLFQKVIPSYDPLGEVEVSRIQWAQILENGLALGGEVFECLNEADVWVRENFQRHDVFTMIGM